MIAALLIPGLVAVAAHFLGPMLGAWLASTGIAAPVVQLILGVTPTAATKGLQAIANAIEHPRELTDAEKQIAAEHYARTRANPFDFG